MRHLKFLDKLKKKKTIKIWLLVFSNFKIIRQNNFLILNIDWYKKIVIFF